jgi:hypothetical protein
MIQNQWRHDMHSTKQIKWDGPKFMLDWKQYKKPESFGLKKLHDSLLHDLDYMFHIIFISWFKFFILIKKSSMYI